MSGDENYHTYCEILILLCEFYHDNYFVVSLYLKNSGLSAEKLREYLFAVLCALLSLVLN